jgi:amidase
LASPPLGTSHAFELRLPPPRASSLSQYRVLTWFDDADFSIDHGMRAHLEQLADRLRASGAAVSSYAPTGGLRPINRLYRSLLDPIVAADFSPRTTELLRASAAGSDGDDPLVQFARNALVGHREWIAFDRERAALRENFARLFERADVLLCPVNLVPAIHHDHSAIAAQRYIRVDGQTRAYMDLMAWIAPATTCYLPATVVPIGLCDGLPVGVQIIGPYLEDLTPIDFADRLSALGCGFQRPPGF